jgi:hypothetical protein
MLPEAMAVPVVPQYLPIEYIESRDNGICADETVVPEVPQFLTITFKRLLDVDKMADEKVAAVVPMYLLTATKAVNPDDIWPVVTVVPEVPQ